MKRNLFLAILFVMLLAGIASCNTKPNAGNPDNDSTAIDAAHNSQNSLDWAGTYTGVIPCADCEGIEVKITLNSDETYQASYLYLGTKDNTPATFSGKFTWDDAGGVITLDSKDIPTHYQVGENKLIQLDLEGKPITSEHNYTLTKIAE